MTGLVIVFSAILSMAVGAYPPVQTWSINQLVNATEYVTNVDVALLSCLHAALDPVMLGAMNPMLSAIGNAEIPAPSGEVNWTLPELQKAVKIILTHKEFNTIPNAKNKPEQFWAALGFDRLVDLSEEQRVREINRAIEETLHLVTSEHKDGDIKNVKTKVLLPAIDISLWDLADLNKAVNDPHTKRALVVHLKIARLNPDQQYGPGEKRCVITPVGLIPHADPYYYIPKLTWKLLNLAKVEKPSVRRREKDFMRPTIFRTHRSFYN